MEPDQKRRKLVSDKAKANFICSQLRLRLQYAKLKVEHGWQRQSLNEVENLYFRHSHKRRPIAARKIPSSSLSSAPSFSHLSKGTHPTPSTAPVSGSAVHPPQYVATSQQTPTVENSAIDPPPMEQELAPLRVGTAIVPLGNTSSVPPLNTPLAPSYTHPTRSDSNAVVQPGSPLPQALTSSAPQFTPTLHPQDSSPAPPKTTSPTPQSYPQIPSKPASQLLDGFAYVGSNATLPQSSAQYLANAYVASSPFPLNVPPDPVPSIGTGGAALTYDTFWSAHTSWSTRLQGLKVPGMSGTGGGGTPAVGTHVQATSQASTAQ